MLNFVAKNSQYKFLTRGWYQISDLNVLEKFFGTEFYFWQNRPLQPKLDQYTKILVLAPHQDDESIGCGGLMKKFADHGAEISVLYTTDGGQNNLGVSIEESISLRNKEAQAALALVSASMSVLNVSNVQPEVRKKDIIALAEKINDFNPDLILVPWLFDLPLKHRLTNHMLIFAEEFLTHINALEIWGYQVHNHLYPNIVIDISAEMETKEMMISKFESQNSTFKNYTHITKGLNAYNSKYIKGSEYCELFFGLPAREYIRIVRKYYRNNEKEIYRGEQFYRDQISFLEKDMKK